MVIDMFCGSFSLAEKYAPDQNAERKKRFEAAFHWLQETDLKGIAPGSYPIMGDEVFANIQEFTTAPDTERRFEAHRRFFDIQYVVTGEERFGICDVYMLEEDEHPEGSDIWFYRDPPRCSEIIVRSGEMLIAAPEDAHKPGCMVGQPAAVRKAVVKIRV